MSYNDFLRAYSSLFTKNWCCKKCLKCHIAKLFALLVLYRHHLMFKVMATHIETSPKGIYNGW